VGGGATGGGTGAAELPPRTEFRDEFEGSIAILFPRKDFLD
jgi:hypothetical protein